MATSIRALRADDIGAVVEFSVRAWKPNFESFARVMGPEIYMLAVDPDHQNQGIGLDLVTFAVDRIAELGIPLVEIVTGGDPGHAPARYVYEKAGFTALPLVRYYKTLPGK